MHRFETEAYSRGYRHVAGVDEAGRGPLAGPVVSAAVILPREFAHPDINDSKKLSEKKRKTLFRIIHDHALAVGVGTCSPEEIDAVNILNASLLSMKRAVDNLTVRPDFLLIDGKFVIDSDIEQSALIRGDSRSLSIAAASIIAKVTRDAVMTSLDERFPQYLFSRHKGYPTRAHRQALLQYGPCPVHRRTFRGVKEIISHGC